MTCVDEDLNDVHQFDIRSDSQGVFEVDGNTLKLATASSLPEHVVTITCFDSAGLSVTQQFTLEQATDDLNDVTINVSGGTVSEDAPDGTFVGNQT